MQKLNFSCNKYNNKFGEKETVLNLYRCNIFYNKIKSNNIFIKSN